MSIDHLRDLAAFTKRLEGYGVPANPTIEKALTLDEHLHTLHLAQSITRGLTGMTPAELTEVWRHQALGEASNLTNGATERISAQLWAEALDALRAHLPAILKVLRPKFDKAAREVVAAAQTGITPNADAQAVIDLDNPAAITAWRKLRPNAATLGDIARVWVELCETLHLPPTRSRAEALIVGPVDYTACFVHPDSGVTSGYRANGNEAFRWLSLAIATGGRLRLNSPEDVALALNGEGQSPGWIICAAGAVVTDDEGRQLQLYRHDWIPSWVDDAQLDNLIDSGFVVAARPELTRPADKYPLGSEHNPTRRTPALR